MVHLLFAFELPTAATIISVAVALVLIYKGILEKLITSYSGLAASRKEEYNDEVAAHAKTKDKLKLIEEAYALALVEIDTSRRIRLEHNGKIRELENALARSRGLTPQNDAHRTES